MAFAHSPKIVTDGLVLALDAGNPKSYPGSGTVWRDKSGNGNDGTLTNGPTFSSDNGGAIVFDSANDNASIPHDSTIDFATNSFSLHTWVRTAQTGTTRFIMGKGTGIAIASSVGYNLYLGNIGTTWLFGLWDGTGNNSAGSTDYVEVGKWVNLCGVYSAEEGRHRMYTNGQLVSSLTRTVDSISTTNSLYVGVGPQALGHWDGDIAYSSIYNRALSASEVQQNYNALKGRFGL
jgi:hypothetical protein